MVWSQVDFVFQETMQLTFSIKSLKNCHGTQCRPKLNPNHTLKQPTWSLSKLSRSDLQPWRVIWRILKANLVFKAFSLKIPCWWLSGDPTFHFVLRSRFNHYSGSRSVVGKNWNQNTSKKRPWLIFGYVLGSVFVAQPSKVSRNKAENLTAKREKASDTSDMKG